jgi:hypothetical protein
MTTEALDGPGELRRLIAEGAITEEGLQSITGIGQDALQSFINYEDSKAGLTSTQQAFSADENLRLSILAAQLADGVTVPDDERLSGILESLTIECNLTPQNIARLLGLDTGDVSNALSDPKVVPAVKKYEIAIRASYLINAFNRAGNR